MSAIVNRVATDSIAEDLEIQAGDIIQKVNDISPRDLLEYRELCANEEVTIEILRKNGELEIIEIEKDFDEDLGIIFENAIFDKIKPCANNCIFCFVDQQPDGLRDTLYIKDDDYRLSYLQGTYITLTNLTKKDKERIEKMHLGPLYVSVHTTNPELRTKMLRNPRAANIINDLQWLCDNMIPVHLQIVLCPDFNDGNELKRTLNDLEKFKDIILSIAVVPVGVTQFRTNELKRVDKACALDVIKQISNFNKKMKKNIACASDEFFLIANKPIPQKKYYGEFGQIEDGVGAIRLLIDDFNKNKKRLPSKIKHPFHIHLCTSKANKNIFSDISEELNKIENLMVTLSVINSDFFGSNITVAGLVTATDIINQLSPTKDTIECLILPAVMLRPSTEIFLDGKTISDVEDALECNIFIVEDYYSTAEIIDLILSKT